MDEASNFEWLKKPWMYAKPKNPEALDKWRQQWINYILHYCEKEGIHIVNIIDLKKSEPFNKLDENSFNDIVKALVDKKYAKFFRNKETLRIYWRSIDEWTSHIWKRACESKKTVLKGKEDIFEVEPKLIGMPEKDISCIIKVLVKHGLARWIDKKNETIKIIASSDVHS